VEEAQMRFSTVLHNVINKQKRKTGTRAYYANGQVTFSRLFGYKLISDRYEPDPRYAPAIKTIFEMLADGKTLIEVKKALDSMKARDSSNNRYSFARIISLVRPIYCGYIEQRGKLVEVKNLTPIVTLEVYRQAAKQVKLEQKKLVTQ
jgi:hypothetical protein